MAMKGNIFDVALRTNPFDVNSNNLSSGSWLLSGKLAKRLLFGRLAKMLLTLSVLDFTMNLLETGLETDTVLALIVFSLQYVLVNHEFRKYKVKTARWMVTHKVAQLMMIDCKRAVPLFIQLKDIITPYDVVSQLQAANNKWDYRYSLYFYLHSLFVSDTNVGRDFHDMQVELYADYDPKMLLPFLRNSQHYTLEKAHEICVKRDLLRELVFILGRMGNAKQALAVIINKMGDIEEAIEFVSMQKDDELWEELIKQCLNKNEMVGVLLEHTVGNLDPLYIVNMVLNGVEIPRSLEERERVIVI